MVSSNIWTVRVKGNDYTNIYKIAQEAYPNVMTNRATDWVEECISFRAKIITTLKEKYPLIFEGMDYDSCIRVTHRKDFDTLEFRFNGPFLKQVEEKYPEALI